MKKYVVIIAIMILSMFALLHCVNPPEYPDEPEITYLGLSKQFMNQSSISNDSIAIQLSFTDGDGDLGFQDTTGSIFIIDTRDGFMRPAYRLPFIPEQGNGNGISGDITMIIYSTCCIYAPSSGIPPCDASPMAPQATDTVSYRVRIKDRAGHFSNEITTEPIVLKCRN